MRLPFHSGGSVKTRRYQTQGWKPVSPIPLSGLSKQKGTVIFRENGRSVDPQFCARPTFLSSNSNCHSPLRFSHESRTNWGWGCSSLGSAKARQKANCKRQRAKIKERFTDISEGVSSDRRSCVLSKSDPRCGKARPAPL